MSSDDNYKFDDQNGFEFKGGKHGELRSGYVNLENKKEISPGFKGKLEKEAKKNNPESLRSDGKLHKDDSRLKANYIYIERHHLISKEVLERCGFNEGDANAVSIEMYYKDHEKLTPDHGSNKDKNQDGSYTANSYRDTQEELLKNGDIQGALEHGIEGFIEKAKKLGISEKEILEKYGEAFDKARAYIDKNTEYFLSVIDNSQSGYIIEADKDTPEEVTAKRDCQSDSSTKNDLELKSNSELAKKEISEAEKKTMHAKKIKENMTEELSDQKKEAILEKREGFNEIRENCTSNDVVKTKDSELKYAQATLKEREVSLKEQKYILNEKKAILNESNIKLYWERNAPSSDDVMKKLKDKQAEAEKDFNKSEKEFRLVKREVDKSKKEVGNLEDARNLAKDRDKGVEIARKLNSNSPIREEIKSIANHENKNLSKHNTEKDKIDVE